MKIFDTTFIIFFISAGIVDCANSEDDNSDVNTNSDEEDSSDFQLLKSILLLKSLDSEINLKNNCVQYGGDAGFDNLNKSLHEFVTSVESDPNTLTNLATIAKGGFQWPDLIHKIHPICSRIFILSKTHRNLINSYKSNCVDPKFKNDLDNDGILFPILEFLCKCAEEPQVAEIDDRCFQANKGEIETCVNETSSVIDYIKNRTAYEIGKSLWTAELDVKDCRFYEALKNCIDNSVKYCEKQNLVQILDSVFNIIEEHSHCKKLLKSNEQTSSIEDTINAEELLSFFNTMVSVL